MGSELKVGVHKGDGPPPGYVWMVLLPDIAYNESMRFLNPGQYEHMAMQVKELARESDPTHSQTASVDAIGEYWELRDKGGILGNLNVRVFFYLDKKNEALVVLGAIKKQNDGPTPLGDKMRMARRLRKYLRGEFQGS
jgi:hypothetical protein